MLRMQEDRRDRALRASLDWVLTAVLIAVLRTPTLLTPNRLQRHVSPVLLER